MSEATVRCPKCGEKLQVTLSVLSKQPPDTRFAEPEKQIQVEVTSRPKAELDVEAVDWKP